MGKVRIVHRQDGISIIRPCTKSRKENETEEAWLDRVFAKCQKESGFEGYEYEDVDESELPQDRTHRNAWEKEKGKKIRINDKKKQSGINKKKIAREYEKELRKVVIDRLKSKGELPQDYND